jgi:hypothetical protein
MHAQSESAVVDLAHEEAMNSLPIAMLRPNAGLRVIET